MSPDDPRHGTRAGSGAHYRDGEKPCEPCYEARRRYYRRYHKQRRQGYVRRIRAGHRGVWESIDRLHEHGYSFDRLAEMLGCIGSSHLYAIHHGGPDGEIHVGTWRKLAASLSAVKAPPTRLGTLRRLQALHRLGWTVNAVMDEVGISREVGKRALRGQHVTFKAPTMQAIADTYDRLSMTLPPPSAGTTRARLRAEREGWAPPLAWDDIDRDPHPTGYDLPDGAPDPVVVDRLLAGERIPSSRVEKVEAMRRWLAAGGSERSLCLMHGWKDGRYVEREVAA